jgi:hypothetical protein
MKLISSLFISLTLVGPAISCSKGKEEIPTGFLGSEGLIPLSIDDDISNSILWNSVSGGDGKTISLGNQSYIFCEHQNISGECIP